jgi:Zn-dependent M28 family amino/carboxypeptidase
LLELAAWFGPDLQARSQAHRLQFAAYDLEEWGMVGSFVHSRDVQRSRVAVRGMISLEMLGYTDSTPGSQHLPAHLAKLYPDVGNFIGICGNDVSLGLLQAVAQAMKSIDGLPVECLAVPANGALLPEVRLSDHSAFWDRGFQALMITDTSFFRNPHYHLASDTPETLDYAFLAKVTAGVFAAVSRLTE